ncbi:hypothetical protein [Mariniblastus fucicola]|uniref:hypothetical protein n=1 Tax=Mariniblastus fucicola TaxID=980251 RepID=UPI0011DF36F4|nr:hypothetical protein [Mariniblastus fucicola]
MTAQTDDDVSVSQYIERLADPDPEVRDRAETKILALGDAALPLVKAALESSNLEIHSRCRNLLERMEIDRRKRLAKSFLQADAGKESFAHFRAWPKFNKFVNGSDSDGSNILSRKLFLKMCLELPLAFEDYDFKSEQSGTALKQAARLTLIPDRHPGVASEVLLIGYLFLADHANRIHAEELRPNGERSLFSDVEVLEAVNFISSSEHAQAIRRSEFREVLDRAIADWIRSEETNERISGRSRVKLIFVTCNPYLIDDEVNRYDALKASEKLGLIDIVAKSSKGKTGVEFARCAHWLKLPLDDESVAISSRLRRRPAEKVEISVQMLAQAVLAGLLNEDLPVEEQIQVENVFGIYPLSGAGFSIIKSETETERFLQLVRVRLRQSKAVE